MELMLAIAAGAGLITGIATTRVFGGRKESPLVLPPADPEPALEEFRVLRALCGIPNVSSIRRYTLASEASEAMQATLESLVVNEVRAAAVTAAGGVAWAGVGEPALLSAASSFAARLEQVPEDVWRVSWRSQDGIEVVAQRFPMVRSAQWLVCVASGTPVDRIRLARAAYESGLAAATTLPPKLDGRTLSGSDLSSCEPVKTLAAHTPLLASRTWAAGETLFSAGEVRRGQPMLSTQVELQRWGRLVSTELGAELGTMYEAGETRTCFHPVGDHGLLELTSGMTRPYPWRRAYAAARQLAQMPERREAI